MAGVSTHVPLVGVLIRLITQSFASLSFLVDLDHDHTVLDSLWVLPTEQCWEVHKMTCYKWRLSF